MALRKANLEKQINSFIQLTSNISMAISALTILSNLGSIWKNEDLTVGEKLL